MTLTSLVGVLEVLTGAVCFFIPSVGPVAAMALLGLGLSTLGIRTAISNQVQGIKGAW